MKAHRFYIGVPTSRKPAELNGGYTRRMMRRRLWPGRSMPVSAVSLPIGQRHFRAAQ